MAFQGMFRRINKHVVVRPIHLTAKTVLEVGTVIDPEKHNVKVFQLRLWFQRRRIGIVDSPWANAQLEGDNRPEGLVIRKTAADLEDEAKHAAVTDLASTLVEVADNPPLIGLETIEGAVELLGATQSPTVDKAPDSPAEVVEEPEQHVTGLQVADDKEQAEADAAQQLANAEQAEADKAQQAVDAAKVVKDRARKDAKNKRERERRAAKNK